MYSVTEVANYRKCSRQYILELIQKNKLKATKVGNTYIIDEKECVAKWGNEWKKGTNNQWFGFYASSYNLKTK